MKRIALIDGDEVAFKACAVTANTIDWGDGDTSSEPSPGLAVNAAVEMVKAWADKVQAEAVAICLSCRDRKLFRREVDPSYKQERTEKPAAFWAVIDKFERDYDHYEHPGLEADDVMGIMSEPRDGRQPIIVSSDKDMRTVPCWLFDPYHGTKRKITEVAANYWWMTQTLIGDPSDGYKGLPKCGPKTAEKILDGASTLRGMWTNVLNAYIEKGHPPALAIQQARLARILRPGDYNYATKGVNLWTP